MAAMAFATRVVFGNRVVPPKELLAVVDGTGQAMFDASVSAKMSASAKAGTLLTTAPEGLALPSGCRMGASNSAASRAACAGILVCVARAGLGVRAEVAEWLCNSLNAGAAPQLPEAGALGEDASFDATSASSVSAAIAAAAAAGLEGGLTADEWTVICSSHGAAAGIAAVAGSAARELAVAADVAAALSVEAGRLGNDVATDVDSATVTAGRAASSSALRTLTMASSRIGAGPATGAAEVHGAARDEALAGERAARLEVNAGPEAAAPAAPAGGKKGGKKGGKGKPQALALAPRPAASLAASCRAIVASAAELLDGAAFRRGLVAGAAAGAAAAAEPVAPIRVPMGASAASQACVAAALHALAAVQSAVAAVAAEAASSAAALDTDEAEAVAAAAVKEAARQARAAEFAAADAERKAKEAERVAAMSDKEREAYEVAKAKAAEKAARKAAAKKGGAAAAGAGAAGAVNPAGVGRGLFELRLRLLAERPCPAATTPAEAAAAGAGAGTAPSLSEAEWRALLPLGAASPALPASGRLAAMATQCVQAVGAAGADAKIAKGTRDYGPQEMRVREPVFAAIRSVFKRHGAVEIDTPVFEHRDTLTGKYGEEGAKLIYHLADQGGQLLSLRYDLTVPFARFVASHGLDKIKRFHIARVYRRDQPQMTRGRYREFYQCDFDIAGSHALMVPDAEVISVACEILGSLPIGDFQFKLNHRGVLDGCLELAGVPSGKVRTVCSSIDKLDKEPWADVREELVGEKGVSPDVADAIGRLVQRRGEPMALLAELESTSVFSGSDKATSALAELRVLFGYLEALGCLHRISLDLSLARGLDYYSGVIYEAVLLDGAVAVGSIAAGGRYDSLVGMFSASGAKVPCVGVSIGIERVFAIVEAKARAADAATKALSRPPVDVFVAAAGGGVPLVERLRLCKELWAAGVRAETPFKEKLERRWLENALEAGYPYMCLLGESELAEGKVTVKDIANTEQVTVDRADLVATLSRFGVPVDAMEAASRARELAGEGPGAKEAAAASAAGEA
ncbi:hypothetical protein FNF29_07549 [Cafeteria roenbergensis]|uniref:Histidine--tRNA ligase, cytoplasmic n=1 Tax=Cafeteria roenbergensis TaxID=33653 RepID=A0A5A8C3D8_CAFRO|nr:hypothetical protein FNF29_07549 [Cafeteria roenbergensis]|eukprot:KAA0147177.1 hypothetical protein FNF29_07549 [Cafeteria roenbergensis]